MPFPLPPLSGVREGASALWTGVKGAMPESCLAGPDERLQFAKFGRKRGDVEMTAVNSAEGAPEGAEGGPPGDQPPLQREASVGSVSTVGVECQDHDMITEWQAGWNVTNAIQVRLCRLRPAQGRRLGSGLGIRVGHAGFREGLLLRGSKARF